ncbi:hypothetical protein ACE1AT_20415 [Pelatocladus sp. BLCC-F211]|uniref:hypothetical protein n=1 Tax=Pelatocladus sp. BLCC-F211 TaxID=3342752 RepID=UPI0035BB5334
MAGSFTLAKALPLSESATKQDIWRQTVRVKLLEPRASTQQTLYSTSKHNTADNLELAQLKLEHTSNLSLTLNQQIMTELDNSTREILKSCNINAYFWSQNSFLRIYCYNLQIFSYLKRQKKWIIYLHEAIHRLFIKINQIEVIYQEGEKINVFYRKLI